MILESLTNSDSSSCELDFININNILSKEDYLLPLEDLLKKLPIKYHKDLIKLFKKKLEYNELHFNGFSINRKYLKSSYILKEEKNPLINKYENIIKNFIKDFEFNSFQINVINKIIKSKNKNFLISASTASGKTYLTLFYYLKYGKMVYVVPLKALINDLMKFFNKFNLRVKINCGDEISNKWKHFDILIITPEKLDLLLNNILENNSWLNKFKVLIFDEIHILNDSRGPFIELIYTKLKYLKLKIKLLALSATISNIEPICQFLNTEIIEYSNYRNYDMILDNITNIKISEYEIIFNIIKNKSNNEKKILIFVDSKKETYKLLCNIFVNIFNKNKIKELKKLNINEFYKKYFIEMKNQGFFVHHSSIKLLDKKINNSWSLIVATNTLAWGINIDPDLVIIKSEFDYLNIIQMKGRVCRSKIGRTVIFKQKIPNLIIKSKMNEDFEFWLFNFINFLIKLIGRILTNKELLKLNNQIKNKNNKLIYFENILDDFEYKLFLYYISKYNLSENKVKIIKKEKLIKYLEKWYLNTFSFKCNQFLNLEISNIIEKHEKYIFIPILLKGIKYYIISPLLNICYNNGCTIFEGIKIYNEINHISSCKIFINSLINNYTFYKNFLNTNPEIKEFDNIELKEETNLYKEIKNKKVINYELKKYILRYLNIYKLIGVFKQNSDIVIEILIFLGKYFNEEKKKENLIIKFDQKNNLIIKFNEKPPLYCYLIIFSCGKIEKYSILKRCDFKNNVYFLNIPSLFNNNIILLNNNKKVILKRYLI